MEMHYHIVSRTSDGELALRTTLGHDTSFPKLEVNLYSNKLFATYAVRRWERHFRHNTTEIINCTLPCNRDEMVADK